MRVLLTGARAPVTLDLARRFHGAGHCVFLADSVRFPLARFSTAVQGSRRIVAPRASPTGYVDVLLRAVRDWHIDLVVPTCEEVFTIAYHLDRFQEVCRVLTEPIAMLERLHNKWTFSQRHYSSHARAPESHYLSDAVHVQLLLADSTRWVFKPVFSRFATRTLIGPGPATAAAIRPSAAQPWVAQRRMVGQEVSSYSIAHNGRLQAHALYRSDYRVGAGSGIYFTPMEHAGIRAFVSDVVTAENFTGQIAFDFIVDREGRVWVLEANPRATSGVHLFAAGDRLVDALLGRSTTCIEPTSRGPCMLGMAMVLWGLPAALRDGALRGRGLRTLARNCRRAREVVLQWHDPLPALLLPLAFTELVGMALRHRCRLTEAATCDIEWNGESL
jgi:hypothetical protein